MTAPCVVEYLQQSEGVGTRVRILGWEGPVDEIYSYDGTWKAGCRGIAGNRTQSYSVVVRSEIAFICTATDRAGLTVQRGFAYSTKSRFQWIRW
jgi:hypothetical protein